ncbi:hypothetical protein [Azonexus hydrophilus]|uniref:Conjugal transfer protein TraD n=1 Tax=Azonexus hydrophilus TaxID=418702 RepID=A0ABZ2XF67_9RHOO
MSDTQIKRTKVEIQKDALAKLEAEAEKKRKQIAILESRQKKADEIKQREIDSRLKLHSGGIVHMVGLHRYVYSDVDVRDNPQDALIANLLVGCLLKVSQELENASIDDLRSLWDAGRAFRKKKQVDRITANLNPHIRELEEYSKMILQKDIVASAT